MRSPLPTSAQSSLLLLSSLALAACSDSGPTEPTGLAAGEFRLEFSGVSDEAVSGVASLTTGTFDGSEDRPVVRLSWTAEDGDFQSLVLVFAGPERPADGAYQLDPALSFEGPMDTDEVRAWVTTRISDTQLEVMWQSASGTVEIHDLDQLRGTLDIALSAPAGADDPGDARVQGTFRVF